MGAFTPPPPPGYRAPTDAKAVVSLALGIGSLLTCGVTGLPGILFGLASRADIRRSGGALGGGEMATAGIVTGGLGLGFGAILAAVFATSFAMGFHPTTAAHGVTPAPALAPTPSATIAAAPVVPLGASTIGSLRIVDLDPARTFHTQLEGEVHRATTAHEQLVVMTHARWSDVCKEFDAALPDARMQRALSHVTIVRVDVDDFDDELKASGMLEGTLPWFYKLDTHLHPIDAISGGEWDDDTPENIAPVLGAFATGTLRVRRVAPPLGTAL